MERARPWQGGVIMASVILDPGEWAEREFDECELGDARRTERLKHLAAGVAAKPDGSTPNQTECWADLKAAYRLFDCDDVSFQAIIEPHTRHTREECRPGDVMLLIHDTTELDFSNHPASEGLRPTGNGSGRGFFLHTALMLNAADGRVEGIAAQEIFYRRPAGAKKASKYDMRQSAGRESAVWGRVIDRVGRPPDGVKWINVCDRGADDFEPMAKSIHNGCGFVIRASHLNRKIVPAGDDGQPDKTRTQSLSAFLASLPKQGTRDVHIPAATGRAARTAIVQVRYATVFVYPPRPLTPWLKEHHPKEPLKLQVVELREVKPPKGHEALRWVLWSTEPATTMDEAERIVEHYERRWAVEDYHKCLKTGCRVESRMYRTAARLERVTGVLSVAAVRLLQMRSAAKETPDAPAEQIAPTEWVRTLKLVRNIPVDAPMTIKQFVRQLAGLGGFIGRKSDGEPGWITLWRGFDKLNNMLRGIRAEKKCG
jgi:hypothetical protein